MNVQQKLKPHYKHSEIGMIPEGWDDLPLSALCTLVNGRGFKPHEWARFGYPIIRIQNLNGSDEFNYFSGRFDPKLLVEDGQLLFAWSGSRGTSFGPHIWRGQTAVLNYHTWKVMTFDKKVDALFLFHALRQLTKRIEDAAHGASALVHTQKREMENYLVPTPRSLREQRAIAAALSDADALITSLDVLIAKKRDLKQAAMQQLLTGKTRLPGFKDEWERKRLDAVCSMKSGEQITTVNIDLHSTIRCFGGNGLRGFTNRFTHEGRYCLIGRQGALCGNVLEVEGRFFASEHAVVVTPAHQTDIGWLTFVLERMKLNQYSESSAQPGLSVLKLLALEIIVPPTKTEQSAIATILSDMDAELTALEAKRNKVRAIKQGMMQELLTGRIRLV